MIQKEFLFTFFLTIFCTNSFVKIYGQDDSTPDSSRKSHYSLSTGLKANIPNGNGIRYPDPNAIDPNYPGVDSTRYRSNISYQFGAQISRKVISNFFLEAGIEWNMRKYVSEFFWDSTSNEFPILKLDELRYHTHNVEIPVGIYYQWKRIQIGGCIRTKIIEIKVTKHFENSEELSKSTSTHTYRRFFLDKILYPSIFTELLVYDNQTLPIWLNISYEFKDQISSSVYLGLKVKF